MEGCCYTMNKQSWAASKGGARALELDMGLMTPHHEKPML